MIEFFRKLFKPATSSETAKERLRLMLLSDHLSLAPEVIDALKRELIAVISRYVEVDEQQVDVTFEQKNRAVAMLAEIPIISMKTPGNGKQSGTSTQDAVSMLAVPEAPVPTGPQTQTQKIPKKRPRRRRKRSAGNSAVTAL